MFTLVTKRVALLALMVVPVFAGNDKNYTYLALGDSIAFGFNPNLLVPDQPLPSPDQFTGYPEVVAQVENLLQSKKEVNAACPGQTSYSFFAGGPDNGCEGFRATIGLHTMYPGTQESFAISQLTTNKHINLVTLSIGGNDLILLRDQCLPTGDFAGCVASRLPAVLGAYAQNLTRILSDIRIQSNYKGTLVLVKYYAPSADPLFAYAVDQLNQVMVKVGSNPAFSNVRFAESFKAFQLASALFQGDPCKAGLVIRLDFPTRTNPGPCDVHPTKLGRDLIAATVEIAIHSGIGQAQGQQQGQNGQQDQDQQSNNE